MMTCNTDSFTLTFTLAFFQENKSFSEEKSFSGHRLRTLEPEFDFDSDSNPHQSKKAKKHTQTTQTHVLTDKGSTAHPKAKTRQKQQDKTRQINKRPDSIGKVDRYRYIYTYLDTYIHTYVYMYIYV